MAGSPPPPPAAPPDHIPTVHAMTHRTSFCLLGAALVCGGGAPVAAQVPWGNGFGFQWQIGYKQAGGGYADLINDGIDADINIFYDLDKLRIGAGGNFVSFDVQEPFEEEGISSVELHAFVGYHFLRGPFQPYVQGRGTWTRFGKEGHTFSIEPPDPEDPEGENPAERRSGFGFGVVAGAEYRVWRTVGFEANVSYDRFSTDDLDLSDFGFAVVSDGTKWGVRVGINWYP